MKLGICKVNKFESQFHLDMARKRLWHLDGEGVTASNMPFTQSSPVSVLRVLTRKEKFGNYKIEQTAYHGVVVMLSRLESEGEFLDRPWDKVLGSVLLETWHLATTASN